MSFISLEAGVGQSATTVFMPIRPWDGERLKNCSDRCSR